MFDTVIRNGTIVDGSGATPVRADVAVTDGVVSAVGPDLAPGQREIDATGLLVTPGFVDIHTHYDGQVTWDPVLTPSSLHGVTTIVMGNCGVGFAPVAADRHEWLIGLMEGVEDIPGSVLSEGMVWNWETFPEYLDAIDQPHAIDFAAQVPHDAVRTYVMGDRGANHESMATVEQLGQMRQIIAEAIRAGALGWSTGRTPYHKTVDGSPTPSMTAPKEELVSLAYGLSEAGAGVIDIMSDFLDNPDEIQMIREMSIASGRPISITILQRDQYPDTWRDWLDQFSAIADETKSPIIGQVSARAIGVMLGWELTMHPFISHPSYKAIAHMPLTERIAQLRRSEVRAQILAEEPETDDAYLIRLYNSLDRIYRLGDPPNYAPRPEESLVSIAAIEGGTAAELAYDYMLAFDGQGLLYFPTLNHFYGDLGAVREMLAHPNTVPALGDGGAHCGLVSDASFPTTLLSLWGRDRAGTDGFPIEWLVKRQAADTAAAVELLDRGRIAPGYRADINLIDFENLAALHPKVVYDLPGGGRRLMQEASGYVATLVAGVVVFENGLHTGALPGRLVRGAQEVPGPDTREG